MEWLLISISRIFLEHISIWLFSFDEAATEYTLCLKCRFSGIL